MATKKTAAPASDKVKLSHVTIRNILGIKELEFDAGTFTEITGKNGQGKTSVLEAIQAALSGGHDATLLHNGADKGEVVLVLDNDTTITKRITAGKSDTIVARDGMRALSPANAIRQLVDILAVNPIEFLRAPRKERVNALFEAMPMPADIEKLETLVGRDIDGIIPEGMQALDAIASLYKIVYDERTGTNRLLKDKNSTVSTLKESLPAESKTDITDDLQKARQDRDLLEQELNRQRDRVRHELDSKLTQITQKADDFYNQIKEIEQQIAELMQEKSQAKVTADAAILNISNEFAKRRQDVAIQISKFEQQQAQITRTQQTRETIQKLQTESEKLQTQTEEQSEVLNQLDEYKAELLANLPIPGLEVRDGEIYYQDVTFDRLNSAQQVTIAVELAKLRSGKLGLICVDGIELLDKETYKEFKKQAVASGLQMVVAKVSDSELEITTQGTAKKK